MGNCGQTQQKYLKKNYYENEDAYSPYFPKNKIHLSKAEAQSVTESTLSILGLDPKIDE